MGLDTVVVFNFNSEFKVNGERNGKRMIFGLGIGAFIWCIVLPLFFLVVAIVIGLRNRYEGQKVEELYGEEGWYHTL
mgnify:FL=1